MDYYSLSQEDFDAVVTGELTHYALWLEDMANGNTQACKKHLLTEKNIVNKILKLINFLPANYLPYNIYNTKVLQHKKSSIFISKKKQIERTG